MMCGVFLLYCILFCRVTLLILALTIVYEGAFSTPFQKGANFVIIYIKIKEWYARIMLYFDTLFDNSITGGCQCELLWQCRVLLGEVKNKPPNPSNRRCSIKLNKESLGTTWFVAYFYYQIKQQPTKLADTFTQMYLLANFVNHYLF